MTSLNILVWLRDFLLISLLLNSAARAGDVSVAIEPAQPTTSQEVTLVIDHLGCGNLGNQTGATELRPGLARVRAYYRRPQLVCPEFFRSQLRIPIGTLTAGHWQVEVVGYITENEEPEEALLASAGFDVSASGPLQIPAGSWPSVLALVLLLIGVAWHRRKALLSRW